MKVAIELPELPKGWEYTGEYRVPSSTEHYYFVKAGAVCPGGHHKVQKQHIVRKKLTPPELFQAVHKIRIVCGSVEVRTLRYSGGSGDLQDLEAGNLFLDRGEAERIADMISEAFEKNRSNYYD